MKKMAKKILSLFLTAVLIIGLVPAISVASTEPVVVDKTAQIINLDSRTYEVALSIDGNPGDKPIDVVVVLDTSASMDSTKLKNMKDAASDFVKKVLPQGNSQNRVSVISYGGTATVQSGFTNTQGTAISAINGLSAGSSRNSSGGTNTHAGMLLASEMLSRFGNANATQSVVFISDGVPTYYLDGNNGQHYRIEPVGNDKIKLQYKYNNNWEDFKASRSYSNLSGLYSGYAGILGNGGNYQSTGKDRTISVGLSLKARGINVFTIGLLEGLNNTDKGYARATLNPSAPNNYQASYFETASSSTLDTIYDSIKELVANAGTNGIVTDIVPAEFDLVPGSFKINNVAAGSPDVTYDLNSKTITWNKGNINDGDAVLTYQLVAKPNYYGVLNTNESASLVYTPVNGSSNVTLNFPVPNVPVRPYATDDAFSVIVNKDLTDTVATNDVNTLIMDSTGYTSTLTYELVDAPYAGFVLNSDGSFDFNHNVVGPITFTYKSVLTLVGSGAFAGTYKSDLTTVTIDVLPVPQYTLTVQVEGSGTVSPTAGDHDYDENTVVSLVATPAAGHEFAGWSVDITDANAVSSVTMDTDKTVKAKFTAIPLYELEVNIDGDGIVNITPNASEYLRDTQVALEAVPGAGYIFAGWSGHASGSNVNTNVTMTEDKSVTATFTPVYTLTINVVGNGSANASPSKVQYSPGEVVDLTAVVGDTDTQFDGWSGDLTSTNLTGSITMNSNKVVTATFSPIPPNFYTLTVTKSGEGSVSPNGGDFVEDTTVPVTATPAQGWEFTRWELDLTSTDATESILMDGHKAIRAVFTEIPVYYDLTTQVVGLGSINVNPDSATHLKDTVVTLEAIPALGSRFVGWTGDASGTIESTSLTMTKDMNVTATFELIPPTMVNLTVVIVGQGSTTPAAGTSLQTLDSVVPLTATPALGWRFAGWSENVVEDSITMNESKTITATFEFIIVEPNFFTLSTNTVGSGTVSIDPNSEVYESGSTVNLVATPASGWSFTGWSGNLSGSNNSESLLMDGNKSVTATFTENIVPPVQPTTEPPAVLPTEVPTEPATEPETVEVDDEEVALGAPTMMDIDQFKTALPVIEPETVEVDDEETPLADALPDTGQLPSEVFFGIGGLISAAGAFLKKKK